MLSNECQRVSILWSRQQRHSASTIDEVTMRASDKHNNNLTCDLRRPAAINNNSSRKDTDGNAYNEVALIPPPPLLHNSASGIVSLLREGGQLAGSHVSCRINGGSGSFSRSSSGYGGTAEFSLRINPSANNTELLPSNNNASIRNRENGLSTSSGNSGGICSSSTSMSENIVQSQPLDEPPGPSGFFVQQNGLAGKRPGSSQPATDGSSNIVSLTRL